LSPRRFDHGDNVPQRGTAAIRMSATAFYRPRLETTTPPP
jgi:hypothetical protein